MGETGREAYAAQPDCRTIDRLLQAVSVTEKMNAIWEANTRPTAHLSSVERRRNTHSAA
jgi:hypothetical protein